MNDRIKEATDAEELAALKKCLILIGDESKAKSAVKATKLELDELVFKKIPTLSEDELKTLIVHDKWLATVETRTVEDVERMTQQLANRVKTLEERYSETLPTLTKGVEKYTGLVETHLKKMGLAW